MPKLRIIFLTEGENSPSTRFAVTSFVPYFRERGLHCTVAHRRPEKYALINLPFLNYRFLRIMIYCLFCYPYSLILRFLVLLKVKEYDIVFLQRDLDENHTSAWLEKLFRRRAKYFIFYFDDALWLSKTHLGKSIELKIQEIIRLADWVIVSHQYLAEYAKKFNKKVTILSMSIDTLKYTPPISSNKELKPVSSSKALNLGWIGGGWNYSNLTEIGEVLQEIKQKTGVNILIYSGEPPPQKIQKIGVIYLPWNKKEEKNFLQGIDIALCPLIDSPWTRGKFSIKLLQYMSAGIPVICSDVGVNKEVIINNVTGYVVKDKDEWRSRLRQLIFDEKKREQMGRMARQRAEDTYSLQKASSRLVDFFENMEFPK